MNSRILSHKVKCRACVNGKTDDAYDLLCLDCWYNCNLWLKEKYPIRCEHYKVEIHLVDVDEWLAATQ